MEGIEQYVVAYNEAIHKGEFSRAKMLGESAVREAARILQDPQSSVPVKEYCKSVIKDIGDFLKNPTPSAPATAGGGSNSEDKIHNTDWFAAPIPNLKIEKDIAGLQRVIDEFVVNIYAPLLPDLAPIYRKFRGEELGLQVLLYGPPGTGKTHVVKCLAGSLQCKIAVVQIKDVMANLVGDGAKIISEIFEQAKQHEKCIIFFDEIDAIASSREGDDSRHTKEQLTTLLTNMDGFTSKAKPGQIRIVIAATNRPWALDSAVKRGGRFDTQIYVPLPDDAARETLICRALRWKQVKVENRVVRIERPENSIPCADDVTMDWLIEKTEGYAGADIKSICYQAAGYPLKREIVAHQKGQNEEHVVTKNDFEIAFANYINPTNEETLMRFDAYSKNMEYNRDYIVLQCRELNRIVKGGKECLACYEEAWLRNMYYSKINADGIIVPAETMIMLDIIKETGKLDFANQKIRKCKELLPILSVYLDDNADGPICEEYEREWMLTLWMSGYLEKQFGEKYAPKKLKSMNRDSE